MLKKLVVGGIVSMFMMVAAIPGFAASTCTSAGYGTKSCPTVSCSKSNPQLVKALSQLKAKKCCNTKNAQALLQKYLGSNCSVKSCSTNNNCVTIRCSNGKCYRIYCPSGSCPTSNCASGSCR
ncbi:MAG: hypothetical protein ACM3KR_05660 [Deltaproteobacteria bacterium]